MTKRKKPIAQGMDTSSPDVSPCHDIQDDVAKLSLSILEQKYRMLVESINDIIFSISMDGCVTFVSHPIMKMLGYSPEEIVGLSYLEFIDPRDHSAVQASWVAVVAGTPQYIEFRMIAKSGKIRWASASSNVVLANGEPDSVQGVVADITERKRNEEFLQKNQEHLRLAMLASQDGIWDWNLTTDHVYFDPRYYIMSGYAVDEFPHRLEEFTSRIHPEDADRVMAVAKDHFEGRTNHFVVEFRFRMKSGDWQWVQGKGTIMERDSEGKPLRFAGTHRDITERKQAEEKLRASHQMIEDIINTIPVRVFWKDKNLAYLGCNKAFAADAGYTDAKGIIGKDDLQMVWKDQAEFYRADDRAVIESGTPRLLNEEKQTSPEGKTLTVLTSKIPLRDAHGEITGVLGTYMDITEHKKAEANLKRLATAIDQAAETVVMTDEHGLIQYVNPAFEAVSGYTREEALGQNPRILKSGWQDTAFYQRMWKTIVRGKTWRGRFVNKRKDGSLYTEDAVISPVTDENGRIVNYVAVKRDISEQLRLGDQLQQSQKMDAIGRLAGGVAHDFNNMLTVILGHVELALVNTRPGQPLYDSLLDVQEAALSSANLTRQLVAFARKEVISPQLINLNDTVESFLKMLRTLIGEGIDLTWLPGKGLGPVLMDPGQIDQILANLCINARDAISGTGKIIIETGTTVFDEVSGLEKSFAIIPGEYVWLTVSDNGRGMDKETQANVFEPFFTTKGPGEGTGLGLSTVYGVVMQNHGYIHLYSEPDYGTTFHIFLPRAKEGDGQIEEKVAPVLAQGSETILLVEDEPSILKISNSLLEKMGYHVLVASTSAEAIELARDHKDTIHLLMSDVVMPKMNGRVLAKEVMALHPHLKVLFMSGYTADIIAEHGVLESGVNFIQKPFSRMELSTKLREVLDENSEA